MGEAKGELGETRKRAGTGSKTAVERFRRSLSGALQSTCGKSIERWQKAGEKG